jgi:TonB family protein
MSRPFRHSRYVLASLTPLLLMAVLNADVTLKYKSEVKWNPMLPPIITQQATQGMNRALPPESLMQFKGGKGLSSAMGITAVTDLSKQEITLMDKEGKRYATVPFTKFADEIAAAMPPVPEQAKAVMASMKSHYSSKPDGGVATIQGMDAEEKQMEITVDMPTMPNVPAGPLLRCVGHIWTPKAPAKNPAIREIAGISLVAYATMNPAAMMAKISQQMPGFGDAFEAMVRDVQSAEVPMLLRMQLEMYMPLIGAIMKQNPQAKTELGAGFDPDAALATTSLELAEISTADIPDSVFEVPGDFKQVAASGILKDMMAKLAPAGAVGQHTELPPPPTSVGAGDEALGATRIRVGGNILAANLIRHVPPECPQLAKQARVQGTVHLAAVVNKDGTIQSLQLISGHPLLVQAAMDAVKQWLYKPTLLNGNAVEVVTQIDVNFELSQ